MDKDTAKLIVKILAILSWIGAAAGIIGGLMIIFGGTLLAGLGFMSLPTAMLGVFAGALAAVAGILVIAMGILDFFIGLGLWRFKNWARVASIVLAVIGLLGWPTGTIVGAVIIYLLAFNKDVKTLFKK